MIGAMDLPPNPPPSTPPFPPTGAGGIPPPLPVTPDSNPGSPAAARLAWLVLLLVLPLVVVMQQLQVHEAPEVDPAQIAAPEGDDVEVAARMGTRVGYGFGAAKESFQQQLDDTVETPLQRFRAAIATAELTGADEAADRLDAVIRDLEGDTEDWYDPENENDQARKVQLLADARLLTAHYRDIAEQGILAQPLDPDVLDGLEERHGYFGELVRIAHQSKGSVERRELLDGAMGPFFIMMGVMILMGVGILAGVGLGITAIVLAATGRIRAAMVRPAPGGSVYLETAVLFVVSFALLQVMQAIAAQMGDRAELIAGLVAMPAQWLLLLVPFWPLLRGVRWAQLRRDLGLYAPEGAAIEVLAGIGAYLALLPVVIAGVLVMLVLLAIQGHFFPVDPDSAGATNPILELVKSLDPFILTLLFVMATVWAPLCEELIFRGALFRHLRSRVALPLAAILSAMVFGMMHGYALIQLIPVTILGFNFALIRAWRGSLIGPIAAHALNNAVVLSLLFALAHVLYG
jgi:membrane protease YdiL (CAAX protease family)